ncbi:ankyrin [Apiospora sp. TS-2023a]
MAQLEHPPLLRLPNELLFNKLEELCLPDISPVTRINHAFHNLTTEYYFDRWYKGCEAKDQDTWFERMFSRAARWDSLTIVHYLATKTSKINLKGLVKYGAISVGPRGPFIRGYLGTPGCEYMENSFLLLALAYDSPRIISFLIKLGAVFDLDADDRSELPTLCLILAMVNYCPQVTKDEALIIACKYAFPRIASTLLAKGADPNNKCTGLWGTGPIHAALTIPYETILLWTFPEVLRHSMSHAAMDTT